MDYPPEVSYRGLEPTEALDTRIRHRIRKLERRFSHLIGCHVALERAANRQGTEEIYRVRIELSVPNEDVIITREPAPDECRESLDAAVHDAFDKAERRLRSYKAKLSGDIKVAVHPPHGKITTVNAYEGFGFLKTLDGREVYFHKNAVLNFPFDELEPGMEVRFAEADDESGPHASSVQVVGKSGHELAM